MNEKHNADLTENAKALRRNMTEEEKQLWYQFLKKLPITFNRQKVISHYIVDFYCAEAKIVIELDGSQHGEKEAREKDEKRDAFLTDMGIVVLRYTNYTVHDNFRGVCEDILNHIENRLHRKL